jgi:hypothetical protein
MVATASSEQRERKKTMDEQDVKTLAMLRGLDGVFRPASVNFTFHLSRSFLSVHS